MKIRGNTVGTPIKPEKAVVKCQNLTEEEKAQARKNIGAAAVGEGGSGGSALVVTIEDDVASHTSEQIYAHVQAGGTAVLYDGNDYITLARFSDGVATFSWLSGEENILTHFDVYEDGSVDAYTQQELASGEYVRSYTYSKNEIDTMLGSYINDIDTLLGGES